MDRILKICLILFGVYWITNAADPICDLEANYYGKCGVCPHDKSCPSCADTIPNVECRHDKKCRCEKGYGRVTLDCVNASIAEYGERCSFTKGILCSDDDNLVCNGWCICLDGYERDYDVGLCIGVEYAGLVFEACRAQPDSCEPPLECDKSTKKCLVKSGYKYDCETNSCEKGKQEYNETCDEESCRTVQPECKPCNPDLNFECQNGLCVCKSEYYWGAGEGKCVRYGEYNEECESINCNLESNLECNNRKLCVCKEGFQYDEDKKRCSISAKEDGKKEGVNVLVAVLGGIYGFILLQLLIGVGIWLWHRRRPGDAQEGH